MATTESAEVARAKDILRGRVAPPEEMYHLAESLRRYDQFGYARQLYGKLRKSPVVETELRTLLGERSVRIRLAQQHALCTYKDSDLPADVRLTRAIGILEEAEDLKHTTNQETLGLAGAIFKRRWQLGGQKQHLERSLAYYRRGHLEGPAKDYGYTGINAAYVLDLLAHVESSEAKTAGAESGVARARLEEAGKIRRELIAVLPALTDGQSWLEGQWWFLVTIAEAYFGTLDYEGAREWLAKAKGLAESGQVTDWEYESTARQLADLARLQADEAIAGADPEGSLAWGVLEDFLTVKGKAYAAGVRSSFVGKVGLALSGGGFRASLFHVGVLAKLAELDVLRSVEVLSCVSGGSIIGAHYYLEVRHLLRTKRDEEITREDYIRIVQNIERDFLAGVQSNIRTRVAAEITTNLKTVFKKNYSRTERIGELFEEMIFSRVKDEEGARPRWMSDLFITPAGEAETFYPKTDNWRRAAKVPILILNATTLNTGHNWQFTASWMGEPAASINSEIDANAQLRRMSYAEAPAGYRRFRLGRAVAASACVPGLFDPIALGELFPGMTVRLVDGGIHDNQGVAGLREQDCSVLLVSDASGQMETEKNPDAGVLAVPQRSLDMLMARVRGSQYDDLKARRDSSLLRGLMFLHLKKDLDVDPLDWVGCSDPYDASDESRPAARRGPLTSYGVRKDVQKRLAAIRTDLDAFSDTEAYALMTSGYLMTEHEFSSCIQGFAERRGERERWRFLALEEPMKKTGGDAAMMRLLEVAHSRALKVWKYSRLTMIPFIVGPVLAVGLLVYALLLWVGEGKIVKEDLKGWLTLFLIVSLIVVVVTVAATLLVGVPLFFCLLAILKTRDRGKT
ncbi:MAG: tetratricopeptide repeat-containing protein, partial [Pyrinomonadaceae bacterium]